MGRDPGAGPGRPVTAEPGRERRARTLERLGGESFDLLVVGAGIVGSRVAYEVDSISNGHETVSMEKPHER